MDNWHVLTVSRGGTVSLLRNLTKAAAKEAVNRLTPCYGPGVRMRRDGDLERVEAFGPDGQCYPDFTRYDPWDEKSRVMGG